MSRPPEEPPGESPEEPPAQRSGAQPEQPWQPPSPQPPPPQPGQYPGYGPPYDRPPPAAPNPYGGGTMSYYQPIESGGMSSSLKVVLGVVIGLCGGFFLWIVAILGMAGLDSSDSNAVFLYAAVLPLAAPALLLIPRPTRPWAVGMMIGTAVTSIGLSSLCSSLLGA